MAAVFSSRFFFFYGKLMEGRRPNARLKLRYKDVCKSSMQNFSNNHGVWENFLKGQVLWRATKGHIIWEEMRTKFKSCKAKETGPFNTNIACCYCGWLCKSSIDWVSHERSCSARWCLAKPTTVDICLLQNISLDNKF